MGAVVLSSCAGIILAAGQGKRMESPVPKVLHLLQGKPLILWCLDSLQKANISPQVVVVPHKDSPIKKLLSEQKCDFSYQPEPKGTGDGALQGLLALQDKVDPKTPVLITYGDTPGISPETFTEFLESWKTQNWDIGIMGFYPSSPKGYGRILTDSEGSFIKIQEEKDCSPEEKKVTLCNSALFCGTHGLLLKLCQKIKNHNASHEYYLTDVPQLALEHRKKVGVFICHKSLEVSGINTPHDLKQMEEGMVKCAEL